MREKTKPLSFIHRILEAVSNIFKGKSIEYISVELRELENIFALITLGSFIGFPSPPTNISLRILPYMGRELLVMSRISERLDDMLGEMAGLFDIE